MTYISIKKENFMSEMPSNIKQNEQQQTALRQ